MQESLSLPRIKLTADSAAVEDPLRKDRALKFKKLKMGSQQHLAGVIPPLPHNRTERSVAAGLSRQQRKSLKTQRTNLNLAEKRMREGNYSEHDEVGGDLSRLKWECSQETTKIGNLQAEIEKLRRFIEDVKGEGALYSNKSEAAAAEVQRHKQRYATIRARYEDAKFEQDRILNMIRDHKTDNVTYTARVEDYRYELTKLKKKMNLLTTSELQIRDRQNDVEGKYKEALSVYETSTRQNLRRISSEEQKLNHMAETETNRQDRKRQLINISVSVIEQEKERQFRSNYNKFLTNRALNRFLEDKMNRLSETNERIMHLYRQANESYGPFSPEEFAARFFNQQPEREKITTQVKNLEENITRLEAKQRGLKKESAELNIQYLALGEQLEDRLAKLSQQEAVDPDLNDQTTEAEGKLKVINEWTLKYLVLLEGLLVSKKNRTQKPQSLTSEERLAKIMEIVRLGLNRPTN